MPKSLFEPGTTRVAGAFKPPARDVTVPEITKIVTPISQLLEQLLPIPSKPIPPRAVSENPLVAGMKEIQNRARTRNNAEAYASTTSATLDAFSGLNANSTGEEIHVKLAESWEESPELTLRIIWNMRSIHEGHNDKIGFYQAFGWLYKYHPRTAIENIRFVTERLCECQVERHARGPKTDDDDFEVVESDEDTVESDGEIVEEAAKMPHGYYKDLLNIIVLAMRGKLTDPALVHSGSLKVHSIRRKTRTKKEWKGIKATKKKQNEELGVDQAKKRREIESRQTVAAQAQKAKEERKGRYDADRALLQEKLKNDKSFLALYVTVAHIFADQLASDIALMKRIETMPEEEGFELKFEISSAAKWAPSLDNAHDRPTNIATAIALVMHSKGNLDELSLSIAKAMTQEQAHVLRSYYRRWVISPLRRFIDVTEVKMSSQRWSRINYKHVPAECMKKNKTSFFKHDEKRLVNYLADVAVGKSSINGATLLPHELLIEALRFGVTLRARVYGGAVGSPERAVQQEIQRRFEETNKKIVEAQWNSLLGRLKESGALESSLGLVDVSGSMGSINHLPRTTRGPVEPIFPAVALGLVLAALAKPPFNNMFITFSATPELLTLPPGGIADQANWMVRTNWQMNTDYEAVFLKLILPAAVQNKVKPEDMVKRLFVFSDMQFDQSVHRRSSGDKGAWQTSHDRVVSAFQEAGYEAPEIVYWNLQRRTTKPVLKDTPGTALLTGFSANMMKLFMAGESVEDDLVEIGPGGEEVRMGGNNPLALMEKALSKSCYAPLRVFD
ncbi:unnamed protein product [Rhizoctonia solani]|uniref:Uncharacterized protein n=2 Tax=Rhizoctonia solani TaxID=456999 RepID=A0A8H2XUI4_9AGAM|nr:DUF2828 domain protein [Rhizoctonia solani AG-3 Rhs1AP]CAE6434399.1 unnamed protein product [Rhizoctonia solani]CAE6524587.1 unnamed protein product [Rhizoctonia solani]